MKYLCLLILLSTSSALAQGWIEYPPNVNTMTDAQFKAWADEYNAGQVARWKAKKEEAKADQPQYIQGQSVSSDGHYTSGSEYLGTSAPRNWGGGEAHQSVITFQTDNPKYVNPGPLKLVNPYCRPKPTDLAEQAAIKKSFDEAAGTLLVVHSADGTPLRIKVAE